MKTRTLGKTGFQVSEVGLGCWQLGNDFGSLEDHQAASILDAAGNSGISFLDTADVYGAGLSEQRIGNWHKRQNRGRPVIATKVGRDSKLYPNQYTKTRVRDNIINSIQSLQVEALDLVQLHCVPTQVLLDGDILAWLEDFKQEGLIRHFGASVETIDEGIYCLEHPEIASLQIIFNLFRQDAAKHLLPMAAEKNVGIIVRLPLASGVLSGAMSTNTQFAENDHRNYNKDGAHFHVGETFSGIPFPKALEFVDEIKDQVLPAGMDLTTLALRWILDHPQVSTVITGASKTQQVGKNASISNVPPLDADLRHQLSSLYKDHIKAHIRGGI